jgi:hypothetical protein
VGRVVLARDAFTVMGPMERFTPGNEDCAGNWKRFMEYDDRIQLTRTRICRCQTLRNPMVDMHNGSG